MQSSRVEQSSVKSKLPPLPSEEYLRNVTMLAALCCCYREQIRKVDLHPRKYASLKGLKRIDLAIKNEWKVAEYTKKDFKKAAKFRAATVMERPACSVGEVNLHEFVTPCLTIRKDSQFNGHRILHLSDIHLQAGNPRTLQHLQAVADELPKLNIDLLAITGDLADSQKNDVGDQAVAVLQQLRQAVPEAYFVCGNHDYDSGAEHVIAQVERAGIRVLKNEHLLLGQGDDRLRVIGLDDVYHQKRTNLDFFKQGSLKKELLEEDYPTLVLAHSIDSLCDADYPVVDLVLSGHTHGLLFKGLPGRKEWLKFNPGQRLLYDHNDQHSGWGALSPRTLSFVSNGFTDAHRRGIKKAHPFVQASEATIIELRSYQEFIESRVSR